MMYIYVHEHESYGEWKSRPANPIIFHYTLHITHALAVSYGLWIANRFEPFGNQTYNVCNDFANDRWAHIHTLLLGLPSHTVRRRTEQHACRAQVAADAITQSSRQRHCDARVSQACTTMFVSHL